MANNNGLKLDLTNEEDLKTIIEFLHCFDEHTIRRIADKSVKDGMKIIPSISHFSMYIIGVLRMEEVEKKILKEITKDGFGYSKELFRHQIKRHLIETDIMTCKIISSL